VNVKSPKGEEAFDHYFTSVYGERWPILKKALHHDDKKVARRNLFAPEPREKLPGVGEAISFPPDCFEINDEFDLGQWEETLLPYYRMDPASLYPALALEVEPGQQVLDLCAAPGGKTLVLLEGLVGLKKGEFDLSGWLVANELSAKRRHRMMTVMKRHLPKDVRSRVAIKGADGSRFGLRYPASFDRILLDAPCSGERGVLQKTSDLAEWKPKRTKSFGIRQYALLSSAFMCLKPGGRLVYSTCSISPEENDRVVDKLLKRKGEEAIVLTSSHSNPVAEPTTHGLQFLPDREGWGPIYFAVIEKK
jgi:16S rRNA C967 or C1407 C5-methylase (RsmB/RsmF family)